MLKLILFDGAIFRDRLLALMKDVWNEDEVFDAWRDALIVLVPNKVIFNLVTTGVASVCLML